MSGTWIILGASSAIGRAVAREAASRGFDLALAGRDPEDMERTAAEARALNGRAVHVMAFDALAVEMHAAFAAACAGIPGTLHVLLLFGTMPDQADMDRDPALALACLDSSLRGAISVLHHLAPVLEARGAGTVVGVGSVAGDRGRLKNYVYGAAKSGLHTYLAGLRNRLGRRGVHVVTVKPGFVDTAMTFGLPGMFLVASPETVARAMLDAAASGRNEMYVPFFWRYIMLIIRHVPEGIFKKLSI